MTTTKILIVEDEMIIAANISLQLTELGYIVTGIVPRGEDALKHIDDNKPDILLLDINLKGQLDGIQTAEAMQKKYDIPIIYLTANSDDANFNRAKHTHPFAFISKPFKKLDLQRAIELTVSQTKTIKTADSITENGASLIQDDCIFVRHNNTMVKVDINAILYIKAERNYCRVFTNTKEHVLVITLKEMDEKLPSKHFFRVHRSYIINISKIDEIATSHLEINNKAIPVTKELKSQLLKRLQTI